MQRKIKAKFYHTRDVRLLIFLFLLFYFINQSYRHTKTCTDGNKTNIIRITMGLKYQ